MKKVALSDVTVDLSRFLRLAEKEEVIITRHGKPACERCAGATPPEHRGTPLNAT